jgi:cell division protein FtsB
LDETRLVVRLHDPRRLRRVLLVMAVLLPLFGFGLYELGQRSGGHSSFAADQRRQALRAEVGRLRLENQQIKDELARLRTSLDVDREAKALLRETLAGSELRIAELNEEIEFYRRIVVPPEGQATLRVQTFEVLEQPDQHYRLRLLLVQSPQRSGRAQGQLDLRLIGTLRGREASLSLQELAAEQLEFEFLYFQDLELDIVLPEGFEPDIAEIELKASNRSVTASFPWRLRGQDGR